MLQISDVRGSWACMNLAKQMSHIIKICISTINGKKRCSKNCDFLVTICVALNWITIKKLYLSQQHELKTRKQMPLTVYIFQVSIKVEVLNVKQAK